MKRQRILLLLILILTCLAVFIIARQPTRLGLDLQGGAQLTLQVKQSEVDRPLTPQDLTDLQFVIERRVNGLGVSEAIVQTVGENQLSVQLPGVTDPKEAERVLGGTAQLEFRKEVSKPEILAQVDVRQNELLDLKTEGQKLLKSGDTAAIEATRKAIAAKEAELTQLVNQLYEPVDLTGKNLVNAGVAPDNTGRTYSVTLRFDPKGGEAFAELTKNLAGTGRSIGIFLDNTLISSPTVPPNFAQTGITGGSAIIEGRFTAQTANNLAIQLRGGALPFPVEVVENRTVGATLGKDSVQRSLYAGVTGLILVFIFMVLYYRLPGLVADAALVIYAILTFASFKILGVTLTLPGIAGFILSIGMAVDANILIFERTREELQMGKTLYRSVESGFYRAFSSILDGNVTTLIACVALFWLGTGLVKGFALTLGIGVVVSMFTAITCSRTFLMLILTVPELRRPEFFCPNLTAIKAQPGISS